MTDQVCSVCGSLFQILIFASQSSGRSFPWPLSLCHPYGWMKLEFGFAPHGTASLFAVPPWLPSARRCRDGVNRVSWGCIPGDSGFWSDAENPPAVSPGADRTPTPGATSLFPPFPALTPRAGCRWSRGRCRCPPAAPPACPASSAPAGRTGSTARSRTGPRRCSRWRTWRVGPRSRSCPDPVPISVPIPVRSRANGHAPTCQFEFPIAPSHWAPQGTPTTIE